MKPENIKFKAKRLDNGEWIIGSFVVMKIPALSKTTIGIVEAGGATLHEIDPVTICQFTGMKDKNGVEVWEHDLLTKDYSVIYEVGYEGCGFKASIKGEDEFDLNLVAVCKYDCICGNKFDRKEGEKNDEEKNI